MHYCVLAQCYTNTCSVPRCRARTPPWVTSTGWRAYCLRRGSASGECCDPAGSACLSVRAMSCLAVPGNMTKSYANGRTHPNHAPHTSLRPAAPCVFRCKCMAWGASRWRAVASANPSCQIPVPRSLAELQAATQAVAESGGRKNKSTPGAGGSASPRRGYYNFRRRGAGR